MLACVPVFRCASSADATSARHSSRPWRIMRKSSCPVGKTAPTVAVREDITPLSGASTWVCANRNCCILAAASCASSRALAVFSAMRYWLIFCALNAPAALAALPSLASATASARLALASATLALICARSASRVSAANVASTCPRLTLSPTLARTSTNRRPSVSLPIMASCQAATLPLALRVRAKRAIWGLSVVTVSAGFGLAVAFLSSSEA